MSEGEMGERPGAVDRGQGPRLYRRGLHRLAEMDEILVMDPGRVVERATHQDPKRLGGLYSRMLEIQRELLAELCAS